MLCSHPYIGRRLQLPSLSLCDAFFCYTSLWTRPATLLQYRCTYDQWYPGIGHANFLIRRLEEICSSLSRCPQENVFPALVLYLLHPCIQYWIVVGYDNWQPVLVPQTLRHFVKVRPVSISWYNQRHVQIIFIKHSWREIGVSLWHIQVVDDAIKLLLKVRVIFKVLGPVLRIFLWFIIG